MSTCSVNWVCVPSTGCVFRQLGVPSTGCVFRQLGVPSTGCVFRQLAQFTGARYVFLTYGAAGRATGASTDITELDYEELSLDYLIVRLISEKLEALAGTKDGA